MKRSTGWLDSLVVGSAVALLLACAVGCSDGGSASTGSGGAQAGAVAATSTGSVVDPVGGSTATSTSSAVGGTAGAAGGTTLATGGQSAGGGTSPGTRSPGCGTTVTRPDPKVQQTMDVDGTTRYYLLDVPSAADNKTPLMLIFALHGYDMNNVAVVGLYNFTSRSGGKAITVYPQGEGPEPGTKSHWGDQVLKSTWTGNTQNYNFIQKLITDLESRFCIDPGKVFITGFSMGGMFTNAIACAHNNWFRGYAPVEGGGPGSCADKNAKPAIIIHQGTADDLAKTSSGEGTRDFWIKQNGCADTTTTAFTGCTAYGNCAQPVDYCVGAWGHTIDRIATGNIWSFFSGLP